MIASFSALDVNLLSNVLWSNVSTNFLHFCIICSFVILVISSFISCRAGNVESLDLRSSRAFIFSNISVRTGSVSSRCHPQGMWCDAALRMMARKIFYLFFCMWSEAVFSQIVFYLSTASVTVSIFRLRL